jgi:hypothetical protein
VTVAVSLSETVGSLLVEVMVSVPFSAVLAGCALTRTVRLCPLVSVTGSETVRSEKALSRKTAFEW